MSVSINVNRRTFLSGLGISFLAAAGVGSLASCGSRADSAVSNAADVAIPTFQPIEVAGADLPGSAEGIPPGFFNYPTDPFQAVTTAPLDGDTVTALTLMFTAPPNAREDNPTWQAVEEALGGTLDIDGVADSDYGTRLNTVVAGGDLPDLMFNDGAAIPDIVPFLRSSCTDLGPYLAGDAALDYPNLAAIPEIFWRQCVVDGTLFYIPIPRSISAGLGFYNATLFRERAGVDDITDIKDADELYEVMTALTDAGANHWAFGASGFGGGLWRQFFGLPNGWRDDNGSLTHQIETEEYLTMADFLQKAYADGLIVEGSAAWTKDQMVNNFCNGTVAFIYDGLPGYYPPTGYYSSLPATNPEYEARPIVPFGDTAVSFADNTTVGTVMVAANDDTEHIKKVLGVVNFLASPFGSKEYMLLNFGVDGVDYDLDDAGNPIATERAVGDVTVPWKFLGAPQQALYSPGNSEPVEIAHTAYSALVPNALENPTSLIFSPTNAAQGGAIMQPVSDAFTDYVSGRKGRDVLEKAIETWRSAGGDKIRGEYEEGLAGGATDAAS